MSRYIEKNCSFHTAFGSSGSIPSTYEKDAFDSGWKVIIDALVDIGVSKKIKVEGAHWICPECLIKVKKIESQPKPNGID